MALKGIIEGLQSKEHKSIAQAISSVENNDISKEDILNTIKKNKNQSVRIGITGPPGAGKSSITNQLIKKYRQENKSVCALLVDPTSPFSSGAVLGDRIRINDFYNDVEKRIITCLPILAPPIISLCTSLKTFIAVRLNSR